MKAKYLVLATIIIVSMTITMVSVAQRSGQGKGGQGAQMNQPAQQRAPARADDARLRSEKAMAERQRQQEKDATDQMKREREEMAKREQERKNAGENAARASAQERKEMTEREQERIRVEQPASLRPQGQSSGEPAAMRKRAEAIYGGELMNDEERNQYREMLQRQESDAERAKFLQRHRTQMDQRARERNMVIDEGGDATQ